jgi:hypothetical protein
MTAAHLKTLKKARIFNSKMFAKLADKAALARMQGIAECL